MSSRGGKLGWQKTLARIYEPPINVADADRHLVFAAAHIMAQHPIAYADCFAAALAQNKEEPLVTGDSEFKTAEVDV